MNIYGFRATDDEESYTCIVRNLISENIKHNYSFRVEVIEAFAITLYAI